MSQENLSLVIVYFDGTVRNSVFDCYIISIYGNFDNKEKPKYMYLLANIIDYYGFYIMIVTIQGHLVFFLENFNVKEKNAYEKGDFDFVLTISSFTMVSTI